MLYHPDQCEWPWGQGHGFRKNMLKFLVKVFNRLYPLTLCIEVVNICAGIWYLFEVLCCTLRTHMSDIEDKVIDIEKC